MVLLEENGAKVELCRFLQPLSVHELALLITIIVMKSCEIILSLSNRINTWIKKPSNMSYDLQFDILSIKERKRERERMCIILLLNTSLNAHLRFRARTWQVTDRSRSVDQLIAQSAVILYSKLHAACRRGNSRFPPCHNWSRSPAVGKRASPPG